MTGESQGAVSGLELSSADTSLTAGRTTGRTAANASDKTSWFEAMARAWGDELDEQTDKIIDLSDKLTNSGDAATPGTSTEFQAATATLNFLSQAANNSVKTAGKAIETLARKN